MNFDWGNIAAIVGAGLGSTGVAGLVTGGLQLSRRGRLRKSISRSEDVRTLLTAGEPAEAAVRRSMEADALRLAALTLVGFPKSTTWFLRIAYVYLVVVTGFVFTASALSPTRDIASPEQLQFTAAALIELALALVAFVAALVIALASVLRQRRDAFVLWVQSGLPVDQALQRIGERGPISQFFVYLELVLLDGKPRMRPMSWIAPVIGPLRLMRLGRLRSQRHRRSR